jgi:hypothetical protein
VLALAGFASAAPQSSVTLRLIAKVTSGGAKVDRPPKGAANKGDVIWARSVLRNQVAQLDRRAGAVVGSEYQLLTFRSAHIAALTARVMLPKGTLRIRGRVSLQRPRWAVSVVGGTGSFAKARGSGTIRDRGNHSVVIFRLRLP